MEREIKLTNDQIREFNLWLFDHPKHRRLSWREQVVLWLALQEQEEAA